jgi:hypothetical protein
MPHCPTESARFFYTPETVFLIYLRLLKLIFCSPSKAKVFICPNCLEPGF